MISPILPNPSLNDPEVLEQTPALQTLVAVLLTFKDFINRRSYKPGRRKSSNGAGFACSGRTIYGRLLDIHYKEQHQKRLYRLAITSLRKNNIDTLLRLHLCVCATTPKSPRGAKGVLGLISFSARPDSDFCCQGGYGNSRSNKRVW